MSRSNAPSHDRAASHGFTLLEVVVSVAISMVIFLAVLGAYFYLARNLTRLSNNQSVEMASRRSIYLFTKDVSAAKQISAAATQITLTIPAGGGYKKVVYNYTNGVLTRTATPAIAPEDVTDSSLPSAQIFSGLTAFNFNFYGTDGSILILPAFGQPIKAVDFAYSTTTGSAANGTQSNFSSVSPRVILRNKPYLE